MMKLAHATLEDIADELRERSKQICTECKGSGLRDDYSGHSLHHYRCGMCGGAGWEFWDQELDALADKLLRMAEGKTAIGNG